MNILIIGGTRFIGPCVVKFLLEEGHEVTLFHRGKSKLLLPEGVKEILGDRKFLSDFKEDFKHVSPEIVLDMIPMTEIDARQVTEIFQDTARRIVAISSMDVYQAFGKVIGVEDVPPDTSVITEESPLRKTYYPYSGILKERTDYDKILVEKIIMGNSHVPGTVLRLPIVYGPGDGQHRVGEFLKEMSGESVSLERTFAGWKCARGYVENIARGIALGVLEEKAAGNIYNIGERKHLSVIDWVRKIGEASRWNGEIIIKDEKDGSDNYGQNIIVDTEKIRNELGYKEIVSFEEGLVRTIDWEKSVM